MTITWWMVLMFAAIGVTLFACIVLTLHEKGVYPLRSVTTALRRPWCELLLLCFFVGGIVQYGATKGTNGTEGASQPAPSRSPRISSGGDDADAGDGGLPFAVTNLCFTGVLPLSNAVCLSVAWPTNLFPNGTCLDLFGKSETLTNGWSWLCCHEALPGETNAEFEVSRGNETAMFFRVSDRRTAALTMADSDGDGIPNVYEFWNETNPYVPDAESVPRITVGEDGDFVTLESALSASAAYSVVSLGTGAFALSGTLVLPPHPVMVEGPVDGYAVLQSSAPIGAVMLTEGRDTLFRNLIVDLRATEGFQAGFWVGGNLPWSGTGAAATFENVRVRASYPGVEHFGWVFYRDDAGPSVLRNCTMNAAGSTWAYGVSMYNAASNVVEDCVFVNMPTNALDGKPVAVLARGATVATPYAQEPEPHPGLSWAGYPIAAAYGEAVDSDGDGISDHDEIFVTDTDPWLADSDGDGMPDGDERGRTDPRDALSHDFRLSLCVTNTIVHSDMTNYVFATTSNGQRTNHLFSCTGSGLSTNLIMRIDGEGLSVSAFRDLDRDGMFGAERDVILTKVPSPVRSAASLTFVFGDIDGDGVNDWQEREDETDPYSRLSLRIRRTVRIVNDDPVLSITNYYAISHAPDTNDVQWTQVASSSFPVSVDQRTETGCLYVLAYRDLNGNGVYDEGADVMYRGTRFGMDTKELGVSIGDADADTIADSCEVQEGTNPTNRLSYCYAASARITGIFSTTNRLTCAATFGTNEIMSATLMTNGEFAVSLGHHTTTNGETVTLWFWDDANSNAVRDVNETYSTVTIRPNGHSVAYEGALPIAGFDKEPNGLMDWWELQMGLSALAESHGETDDNDHDGLINLHEFWAGTDPLSLDGSNTVLWKLSHSIDERLIRAGGTNNTLNIYTDYYQNATNGVFVRNQSCWAGDLDFSCLSVWNSSVDPNSHGGTAISKKHVLFAKHWHLGQGSRLDFVGTNGVVCSRIVDLVCPINIPGVAENDIAIVSLTEELPDAVVPAKLLGGNAHEKIKNGKFLPVIAINQDKYALVQELSAISYSGNADCVVTYQRPRDEFRSLFSENIRNKDSGSPTFLVYNRELILVGTHWNVGIDSSVSMAIDEIRAAMNSLSPGYELNVEDFADNEGEGIENE